MKESEFGHLALATHSMVTSEVPEMMLVFLGGMTMVGAMGSAGPPTSTAEEKCENEKTMRA